MMLTVKLLAFQASKLSSLIVHARFVKITNNHIQDSFTRKIVAWVAHVLITIAGNLRRRLYWRFTVVHSGHPFSFSQTVSLRLI